MGPAGPILLNIMPFIQQRPKELDKAAIAKWISFKQACMIFVPVLRNPDDENKEVISKKFFYCSKCNQWKKTFESIKNIKRHITILNPDLFYNFTRKKVAAPELITKEQEEKSMKNIVGFILFDAGSFN